MQGKIRHNSTLKPINRLMADTPTKPEMTLKEARKRLGNRYKSLTDQQIENIVSLTSRIAFESVRDLGSKISY